MSVEVIEISSAPAVVDLGTGSATVIELGGSTPGATRLDDLTDVAGATAGLVGQALVKSNDGQWRPATVTGGGGGPSGPLSHTHEQVAPSTVWLIAHALPFTPSGIAVSDHMGNAHYPLVSYPDGLTVRLDFGTSVRGIARLS